MTTSATPPPAPASTPASHPHDADDRHQVELIGGEGRASTSARAGEQVVFGVVLVNAGDTPATLVEAELLGRVPASAAEVTDVRVHEGGPVEAGPWPNGRTHDAAPLTGYELAPGAEVAVLLVVRVHETGTWTWRAVAVDYVSADGERHQITSQRALRITPG